MEIKVTVGDKTFAVDRELLLNFLIRNGVDLSSVKTVVKEVTNDGNVEQRSLLHG